MKYIALLVACLGLSACSSPPNEWKVEHQDLSTVSGLQDCTYLEVYTGGRLLYVIRCPNSEVSTNFKSGKTRQSVNTIDASVEPVKPTEELYKCRTDGFGALTCTKANE